MNIFITGINGFLGNYLASHFSESGHIVSGTTSRTTLSKNIIQCKLGDEIPEGVFKNMDVVIHCAYNFIKGEKHSNINGTIELILSAKKEGVKKQFYISSLSARPDAISEYGTSKYQIEERIKDIEGVIIIRPGTIIGKGGVFGKMLTIAQKLPVVPITNGVSNALYLIAIEDIYLILKYLSKSNDIKREYNLYYHSNLSTPELFKILKRKFNKLYIPFNIPLFVFDVLLFLIEKVKIKLPLSSDNLKGYISSQDMIHKSDISLFDDVLKSRSETLENIILKNI